MDLKLIAPLKRLNLILEAYPVWCKIGISLVLPVLQKRYLLAMQLYAQDCHCSDRSSSCSKAMFPKIFRLAAH